MGSVEPVYGSVMSMQTFSDDDFDLTFNWGSAELKSEGANAYVLAAAFQVGGVDVVDGTQISATATIEDPAAPGITESWTCSVNWTKPARDLIGEDAAEGGIAKTATDATVAFTVTNTPEVAAWFGDSNQSGASYSSWYEYPDTTAGAEEETAAEGDAEPAAPAKNSWQLCSAARIVTSDVSGLPVVAGSGLEWKMGTAYTLSNSFSAEGTDVVVTVAESGAMARFAAAATALIAMYAF